MFFEPLLASSIVAATPASEPEPLFPNTRLEIDASAITEQDAQEQAGLWEDIIGRRLADEFEAYHIPLITLREAAAFKVRLSWAGDEKSTDIRIDVQVTKLGEATQSRSFVCEDCAFAPGAANRIIEEMPTLVPLLELPPPSEASTADPPPPAPGDDPPRGRPLPLSALGWSGAAVSLVGAGLLGGGVFLLTREDTEVASDEAGLRTLRTTYPQRTPGIALTAAGGVAIAGGVAMVVLDVRRHRANRRPANTAPNQTPIQARAVVLPSVTHPGLVLSGRF